jgi:5-methylcytosine-specific restriction endonuclease McrA
MKKSDRIKVWEKYEEKCAYCGEQLEYDKMQVDHRAPIYRGTSDKDLARMGIIRGLDVFENWEPSCRPCNGYKSTFTVEVFRNNMTTITDRILKDFKTRLAVKYGIIEFKPFDGMFYFEKFKNK